MISRIKKSWRHLAAFEPGTRFVESYREHHAAQRSPAYRIGLFTLAIVIIAMGLIALPAPGPGTLVLALGLGIMARESLGLARVLDRVELKARSAWKRVKARKQRV